MKKLNDKINWIFGFFEGPCIAVVFGIVTTVLFIQVVCRVAGHALTWSEEFARFFNTWCIFIASSRCVALDKHLSVEILGTVLSKNPKILKIQKVIIDLLDLVFFVYIAFFAWKHIMGLSAHPQYSAALRWNMIFVYAAPFVGMIMMSVRTIQKVVGHIKGEEYCRCPSWREYFPKKQKEEITDGGANP